MASSRQHLLAKAYCKSIEWVEGEATDLPFQDCYFDAIPIGYGFRKCGGLAEGLAGDV
ncbi:hypothetical protein POPTR_010G043601v4 [Populus trichocarpa]|uniref:Uncharacterized protein n=1 Tax=Populus trichocarpa TaxID=3694 RepID=A0ACC0SBB0_POPTR|nr:hypothetical protein POPTR_010G043601v4 [Populus trichocarpa]